MRAMAGGRAERWSRTATFWRQRDLKLNSGTGSPEDRHTIHGLSTGDFLKFQIHPICLRHSSYESGAAENDGDTLLAALDFGLDFPIVNEAGDLHGHLIHRRM